MFNSIKNGKYDRLTLINVFSIVFIISIFFIDGITRYKKGISILIVILSLITFFQSKKDEAFALYKNKLFFFSLLFSLFLLLSALYSEDRKETIKYAFNSTLNYGLLFFILFIPILLHKLDKKDIFQTLTFSFIFGLTLNCTIELTRYCLEYINNGTLPFTTYSFREISNSLVFYFPVLLILLFSERTKYSFYLTLLLISFSFILLGTLSRGAWLAILVSCITFFLLIKNWKVPLAVLILIGITLITLKVITNENNILLFSKLEQTSSSNRYANGTQGTALEMIKEKPILGYGYGNNVYDSVYNEKVNQHPDWVYKKSIGPHNTFLFIWFGTGLLGLTLFVSMIIIAFISLLKNLKSDCIYTKKISIILITILVGYLLTRGMFEQMDIKPLGIVLGFLLLVQKKT
ncbi:O-antigen ligase RfaL [Providencia sp. PROV188]|uniref:O-antigen ligase RfaL n=1 Tax=Providencia sp. PROV188 TaxID=2939731 RepID=UPI0022DE4D3A|nr:O-antigen ligase RfaL [Providencia sp. PROV188]WBM60776.1 O-antigen ligase RfaL [Providencia sp. PROV188]